MDKKNLIYIVGGLIVVGIGYYIFKSTKGEDSSNGEETKSIGGGDGGSGSGGDGGSSGGDGTTPTSTNTGIKGLKGKDRSDFRKDTRTICQEKYGSGKDFRDCKERVRKGGVAFDGGFMDDFADDNFGL